MSFPSLIFLILPIVEIAFFLVVGEEIGWGKTLLLTLITSLFGIQTLRFQWFRMNRDGENFSSRGTTKASSLPPAIHHLLYGLGGLLLILPGFLTDFVGLFLLFPWGRYLFYRLTRPYLMKQGGRGNGDSFTFFRVFGSPFFSDGAFRDGDGSGPGGERFDAGDFDGETVDAEIVNPSEDEIIDVDYKVRRE